MITNVARLHSAIVAAGVAIQGVNSNGLVTPASLQPAAQPTINAFDDSPSAQAAWQNLQDRAVVIALLSNTSANGKALRALMIGIGVALKARNPSLVLPTLAQVKTAVLDAINNGQAD